MLSGEPGANMFGDDRERLDDPVASLPLFFLGRRLRSIFRRNVFILGRSCSGRDFSIRFQPILKKFTVLKTEIQGLHFLVCNL